ncbi:MAG: acyl-CoA/acyl-ACP dehydrogenase [Chloroflexi bacterium]|nr:acyl-CoA/acyl-ACP dehydrogenase [Chloroflexota bacterium]
MRTFAERDVAPNAVRWEQEEVLPWDGIQKLAGAGLMGLSYPKRVGGQARSWVEYNIAMEELGRVDGSTATICHMQNLYPKLVVDDQVWGQVVSGHKVIAFAETEPQAGGDAAAIRTTARPVGDCYILNGQKAYVSLVPGAQQLIVTALTSPEQGGVKGMSLFLVDADQAGVSIARIPEPGFRAHMLGHVLLKNVEVPAIRLLGVENKGFYYMRSRWDFTRGVGGTQYVGAAMRALEDTVEHAKRRRTFGKPLIKWQAVQLRLVDHFSELRAARLLCYEAAWMADKQMRLTQHASMIKTWVAEVCLKTMLDCAIVWGGSGYQELHPIQMRLRNAMAFVMLGGGLDIHKMVLGTEIFGRDFNALKP